MLSTVGERDYSAQEVIYILMGWPLYRSSRTFMTLAIKDDTWSRLNKNKPDQPFSNGIIDKYRARPAAYREQGLLEFARKTSVYGNRYTQKRQDTIVRVYPQFKLTGDPEQDEQFYKMQCILNIPFTGTFAELLAEHDDVNTWQELYENYCYEEQDVLELPDSEDEGEIPGEF